MKIVILGYSGLLGDAILRYLFKNSSFQLICVGRNIDTRPFQNSRIKYCKWDFQTFKKQNLFFLKKTKIVINCIGKMDSNPDNLEEINIKYLKKLLTYINENKLKLRFIHLSSIAVYGGPENYLGKKKIISENSTIKINNFYAKSKLKGDNLIQNVIKHKINNNFSYTILRISNVFGGRQKSNLYRFVLLTLKFGFWIKSFDDTIYNFVNLNDVAQSVSLAITKLKKSRNKIYIISDDCNQKQLYKVYENYSKKRIKKIHISIHFLKFLICFLPLPKRLYNFFITISSRVSYSNKKIKSDLNFHPKFSIIKKLNYFNEKKN